MADILIPILTILSGTAACLILFCIFVKVGSSTKTPEGKTFSANTGKATPNLSSRADYWKLLALWSEERTHYHTINGFYLAPCTIFVALFGQAYIHKPASIPFAFAIAVVGLILSFQWLVAIWRQSAQADFRTLVLRTAEKKFGISGGISAYEHYEEYKDLWADKPRRKRLSL